MSEEASPVTVLCWIQKEFGTETICRSIAGEPCSVADLGNNPPKTLDELRTRLDGVKDATWERQDQAEAVVVCTFPRSKKLLVELGAIGRHTSGRRMIVFVSSDEDRSQ